MTAKLSHRTAVAELIAALVKAPRTMRELCEMSDMTDETVNAWLREFRASGLVYVADYRKNRVGCDSAVYSWVVDDEVDVTPPELASNASAVRVRTTYRMRKQAARLKAPTSVSPEAQAWIPRHDGPGAVRFLCMRCSRESLQAGSGWFFNGMDRIRVCGDCKRERVLKPEGITA
jgi:DNA-binding transcriptional ArsR family regulator